MKLARILSLLLALLALGAAPAVAQEASPEGAPPLQGSPPQDTSGGDGSGGPSGEDRSQPVDQLASTGGRAGLLALTGTGMLMVGVGLRLRLPGA